MPFLPFHKLTISLTTLTPRHLYHHHHPTTQDHPSHLSRHQKIQHDDLIATHPSCHHLIPLPPHIHHIYTAQNNIMAAATTRRKLSVSICIPLHHTLLPLANNYHAISKRSLLVIQCHSEGVFWRGLVPLLMMGNPEHRSTAMTNAAQKVLIHHFSSHITNGNVAINADNNWMVSTIASNNNIISGQHHDDDLSVFILPPNSIYKRISYSRTPSNSPTNFFAGRLIYVENKMIRLTSLQALISTLGGGFFLCRYLSVAVSMARQQCKIALLRGDEEMAFKCRINEGYCHIHSGKLNRGKNIIKSVLYDVASQQKRLDGTDLDVLLQHEDSELSHSADKELSELTVIRNMCLAALKFADLIKKQRSTESKEGENTPSSTHDDFQRIRVVKNRKWIR